MRLDARRSRIDPGQIGPRWHTKHRNDTCDAKRVVQQRNFAAKMKADARAIDFPGHCVGRAGAALWLYTVRIRRQASVQNIDRAQLHWRRIEAPRLTKMEFGTIGSCARSSLDRDAEALHGVFPQFQPWESWQHHRSIGCCGIDHANVVGNKSMATAHQGSCERRLAGPGATGQRNRTAAEPDTDSVQGNQPTLMPQCSQTRAKK